MTVELDESADTERLLKTLPVELRRKGLKTALRAHARPTVTRMRQLTPRGDLNHQPENPPLWKTIKVVIREYGEEIMAVVGASYPEGAHFHLVEEGHRQVLWGQETGAYVPGKEIMAPAIDSTRDSGWRNMLKKLKDFIVKQGG